MHLMMPAMELARQKIEKIEKIECIKNERPAFPCLSSESPFFHSPHAGAKSSALSTNTDENAC